MSPKGLSIPVIKVTPSLIFFFKSKEALENISEVI